MTSDRRAERTRRLLRDALQQLIAEKDYESITVREIHVRAGVSRSTFYLHFRDRDDLLLSGFTEADPTLADGLFDTDVRPGQLPNFTARVFASAERFPAAARAIHERGAATMPFRHLTNLMIIQVREWLSTHLRPRPDAQRIEMAAQAIAGAFGSQLSWWVRSGFPVSAAEMSAHFERFVNGGIIESLSACESGRGAVSVPEVAATAPATSLPTE